MTEKGRRTWNFYFNSHPHEEDDDSLRLLNCHADISTHILTKRMTITAVFFQKTTDISTHILTKRMTLEKVLTSSEKKISTHILTKRMTYCWMMNSSVSTYFNSHPHEEDDNNPDGGNSVRRYFNSHPHEEDDGVPDWQAHK